MTDYEHRLPGAMLEHIAGRIAHLGGWIADLASSRVFWSDEVCDIHGLPRGSTLTFTEAFAFYPPDSRARAEHAFYACARDGTAFDAELELVRPDGARIWVRAIGEAVRDDSGAVVEVRGACQDISARKRAEAHQSSLARRLAATLESITDAFIMVDRDWRFTYVNRDAERLLRLAPREAVIGTNLWERFPEAVGGTYYQQYHRAMASNMSVSFEEYYPPLDLWTEIRAYPSDEGLGIYFLDISKRKSSEAQIHKLAYYDNLTALPNRQLLLERLGDALAACKAGQQQRAVLLIDLDNFKSINDTRGHDKGDILLQLVATRLAAAVKPADTVARFGGDEFVILLDDLGTTREAAERRAHGAAQAILDSFEDGFEIEGVLQFSSASIGVALFCAEPVTADELLKRADLAMYQAKAAGRNAFALFDPAMQARVSKQVALEADLRQALANAEFVLHYQPLANVGGAMTGAEALVRWQHPQRGMVSPAEFIPIAEDTGLILPLGHWVMHTACALLARWGASSDTAHLTMAINVSAHQFHRPDFVRQVLGVLEATGANPRRLKLELTESLLVTDLEHTIAKMNRLKEAGVGFSLDDFGTGYSSLSYLHRLPLNELKIDQSFVRDAINEQHGAVIARTILALGKALNLTVLAEGVETREQFDFIVHAGCQAYQGYLFSRPLPEAQLHAFMQG